jgi:hypothetical protein
VSIGRDFEKQVQRLSDEFRVYDQSVDVVSAWELIFTQSDTPLRRRVRHFERFPSIALPDGTEVTPDFSVLFDQGPGLVGEIASFALNDESVESLCTQIANYDALLELPAGGGATSQVPAVDVMLLVPFDLGTAAVRRIINDRLQREGHPYKPSNAPIIVQFTLTAGTERYVFQRRPDEGNGTFRDGEVPAEARLSAGWFDKDDPKVRPHRFREIKATRAFVNDPIPPLYLATFLWSKTFAVRAAGAGDARPVRLDVVPSDVAEQIRVEHGVVRARDIEEAMQLLQRAKLAERTPTGWVAYWTELHRVGSDRDLADILARRSVVPPRRSMREIAEIREREAGAVEQPTLFDDRTKS